MPATNRDRQDLELVAALAVEAGKIAMRWFREDPQVWMKEGNSPVSEADFAVDNFLKKELLSARPDYGWLSEETDDDLDRLETRRTFVVDPIDGTRGFINGLRQWCVSIAIVEKRRPVVGVLECPAIGQTLSAARGTGTFLNGVGIHRQQRTSGDPLRVTGPRNVQTALDRLEPGEVEKTPFVPSLAYRIALVAMGEIDIALARGTAKDWDLAAADLVITEAGGCLTDLDGRLLQYNCRDPRHGSLVASDGHRHHEMLDLAARAMNIRAD